MPAACDNCIQTTSPPPPHLRVLAPHHLATRCHQPQLTDIDLDDCTLGHHTQLGVHLRAITETEAMSRRRYPSHAADDQADTQLYHFPTPSQPVLSSPSLLHQVHPKPAALLLVLCCSTVPVAVVCSLPSAHSCPPHTATHTHLSVGVLLDANDVEAEGGLELRVCDVRLGDTQASGADEALVLGRLAREAWPHKGHLGGPDARMWHGSDTSMTYVVVHLSRKVMVYACDGSGSGSGSERTYRDA